MDKKNNINFIKNSKCFNLSDLIIYTIVIALITLLFIFFIIIPKNNQNSSFVIKIDNDVAFYYSFDNGITNNSLDDSSYCVYEENDFTYITLYFSQDKNEYNTLKIDKINKTICVESASCNGNDCVHFSPIKNSGSIICLPHKLIIAPINSEYIDLTIGGK